MTKEEAVKEMLRRSRDIVMLPLANEIAQAFGFESANDLGVVVHREAGADWSTREDVYQSGDSVGVYHLALALARHCVPDFSTGSCPYMGTGKCAEWYTLQATRALREWMAVNEPALTPDE